MRRHAVRALVHGVQIVGTTAVFVGAVVGSVMIHANFAVTRRTVRSVANDALSTVFLGRLVIGDVQELTLGPWGHVRVAQAEVFDPEGRRVILAKGINGRIDLRKLVSSLISKGTPEVSLDKALIDDAEVVVDIDANGDIGIARAFFPRPRATPSPVTVKAPSSEDVRLAIPDARIRHAWVHGNVVPPKLDADADDIRARVFISENRLNVEVDEAHVTARAPRGPGQSSDVHGLATGGITVPLSAAARAVSATEGGAAGSQSGGVTMHWDLDGDGSGIPMKAHLGLDGDVLDVTADFPLAQPDVVRRAFPALPIEKPVELHAKAHGKLPTLAVTAHGTVGGSTLDATGELGLRDQQPFRLDMDLGKVDAAAFGGPASDLSGHVHVDGVIASGSPSGTFVLSTKPGSVLAQRAPAVDASGAFDSRTVTAKVHASEPGVDVDGTLTVSIPDETLAFEADARSRDLRALARAPGVLSGAGTAHATGTIDLRRATIAARVVADATGVGRAPASAGSVHADATVVGPIANPVIDVTATAKQVPLTAASKDASNANDPKAPNASTREPLTYPSATAHARIVLSPVPKILDGVVHVDGAEGGTSIDAKADEVLFAPGGVAVRGGHVTGLGAPLDLEVEVQNGALSIRAKGTGIDVQRVAAMTGIRELSLMPEGSLATMDIDVKATPARTEGHVDVTIAGAKDGTAAEVHAVFSGHHVAGRARVAVGALGWIEVQRAELEMPGGLSVANAKLATGALDLRGDIDLSQGAALFGDERIESISGHVVLSARVERLDARILPTVYASAITRSLDVVLNDDGTSTHIGGIDLGLHVGHDGASNETELSLLGWDAKGILGSADAKALVPLFGWAAGTTPFDRNALSSLEVSGVVDMKPRDASDLPGIFARPDIRGALSMHSTIGGSFARPRVTLVARAEGLVEKQTARQQARYAPIDAVIDARWDGSDVVATVTADETAAVGERARLKPHKAGHVRGLVLAKLPSADLFAGCPLAWNASGELDVTDLELAPLPLPMNIRGTLTGRVKLRDLTGEPLLEANARVDDLGISGVRVLRGDVRLVAKNGLLDASARINQEDGGNGRVDVLSKSLQWRGIDVAWDDKQSTKIAYALDRVRLAIARPFVRRSIPEIDGQIDGRGSATIDGTSHVFEGGVGVTGGRLYVNAIGEEITDIRASAIFERDGAFRIQDATAKIGAGEIKASAAGRMKGLRFESVDVVAVVPTKEGVPLSAEGATFAAATGEVHLSARMPADKKALAVTVTVPRAKIMVPARGTQVLQSMDPDTTIEVGIRRADGRLVAQALRPGAASRVKAAAAAAAAIAAGTAEPADNLAARFTVTLGDDVELEGRGVRVFLAGRTIVDIADEIAMTGQITLKQGGTIDVQGRRFVVDRGTVTFAAGDAPTDPIIVAAAYWDAPDRTRIWVEFNGPLKTGKLTLRSEPPYSKNEILSILLFGRADPNQARAGDARPSDTQAATDVGTGLASSGLNQALGDLDEDFDLEQDHTSANRSRTKVGYRLRRNLKVQLGYASGFSQREPDTTYLFLEWQFVPKWSLIGTRGDKGTSILDVLFQHRY